MGTTQILWHQLNEVTENTVKSVYRKRGETNSWPDFLLNFVQVTGCDS
jgi:hypothetical protein